LSERVLRDVLRLGASCQDAPVATATGWVDVRALKQKRQAAVSDSVKPASSPRGDNPTRIEAAPEPPKQVQPDLSNLLGRQVGNYVLERPLAQGGMARVFVARHPHLGREVAVKFLNPELSGDIELDQRFLQEAKVMAGLRHPNIVEIYDFGKLDHRSYYTMELLRGTDLGSVMDQKRRFVPEDALQHLTQICAALEAAHQVGVVHRDLKPANVFVLDEHVLHLKLMDFGIAKIQQQQQGHQGTLHGQILGTPTHMSPEQALGLAERITPRTDLYAFGVIAYEMLTGQLPFSSNSEFILMTMHVRDPVPPLRSIAPEVPKRLAQVVEQCLAKDPAQRPESAHALSQQLHEALGKRRSLKPKQSTPKQPRVRASSPAAAPKAEGAAKPDAAAKAAAQKLAAHKQAAPQKPAPQQPKAVAAAQRPATAKKSGVSVAPRPAAAPAGADASPPKNTHVVSPVTALASSASAANDTSASRTIVDARAPDGPESLEPTGDELESAPDPNAPPPPLLSEQLEDPEEKGKPIALSAADGKVLDKLLRRMQKRTDFPAFLNNVTEISTKADADGSYSPIQLSESILKDFGLTAKLLRMANTLFASRFGGKVFSVKQAVVILGFDSVRSIALGVCVFKMPGQKPAAAGKALKATQGPFHEELAESAVSALVSGEIARVLAHRVGIRDSELAMTCAMFKNLGHQLLMEYLPDEYGQIQKLRTEQNMSLPAASMRVLATSTQKLGLGVAQRWNLPPRLQAGMAANPAPGDRLDREEQKLSALGTLANDLCYIVTTGERHDWQKSVELLIERNKALLVLESKEITGLLGIVCKSFEDRYAALFGPYAKRCRFLRNARTLSGEDETVLPSIKPLSEEEIEQLNRTTETLTERVKQRSDPKVMLTDALAALAEALVAPRLILMMVTKDRQSLVVGAALGDDAMALSKHFVLPVTHKPDVFWAAQRSGKGIVIRDALGPSSMRRVPQQYYEALGSSAFALYPCVSRGYQTALLLCDADFPDRLPLNDRVMATAPLRELIAKIAERLASI
jgi:serine/threonine protein kinase/HD-like signal output (HDOD) protein